MSLPQKMVLALVLGTGLSVVAQLLGAPHPVAMFVGVPVGLLIGMWRP